MGHMKNYRQLLKELPSNKVVFAFGCFQPPTVGHELQVKVVKKLAEEQHSDYVIYATQDLKEDLLPAEKKVQYMNLMFPNTNIKTTDVATFVEAAKELNKKYKNIVMVTSSDCKEDYTKILNKKNGSEFFFETIEVVAAGDINPDDNKLKESAKKGDYVKFKTSMPSSLREIDSRRLMNDMRQSLGLDMVKEEIKLVKDDLRESYFRGEIFNVGEIVESDGQQYEIVKRGSNHLLLKEQSGKLVSKWIQDVTLVETALNPKDPHGDYKAKSKTLQDIQMDPTTSKDPQMKAAVMQRKADLEREYAKHKSVKEGVIQQSGTDDLDPPTVDTNSTYNMAKDRLRYKDFVKLTKMSKGEVKEDLEQEMNDFLATLKPPTPTGHTLNARDDSHRRRKIAYHLGEESDLEEAKKKKEKKQADEFKPTAVEVKIGDDSQQLGANNSHGFDAFFNEEEEKDMSDEDIDKLIDSLSEDDIMDAYDNEELAVVDDETGEELEDDKEVNESLMEVLSRIERMRARVRFAKTKSKRERQVKLALRRTSSNSTINKRARRLAISLMKKRMLRGRPASALSVGEKERIEKMIQKRKAVLNRIAMKLTSRVRQVEKARLSHSKFTQGTPAVGQI